MPKQAERLPAYMHAQNDEKPKPAEGKSFISAGKRYIDPIDNAVYESNGSGHFEGLFNGLRVREHPAHTLQAVTEESDNELTIAEFERLLTYAQVKASEAGTPEPTHITLNWLGERLLAHGGRFEFRRVHENVFVPQRIGGYTRSADVAIKNDIDSYIANLKQAIERRKQEQKETRQAAQAMLDEEVARQMAKQQHDKLKMRYQELHAKATAFGITDNRFAQLFNMTAERGKKAELSDESLNDLGLFIQNEIDTKQLKEAMAAQSDAVAESSVEESIQAIAEDIAGNHDQAPATIQAPVGQEEPAESESQQGEESTTEKQPEQSEEQKSELARETYTDEDGCVRYRDTDEYVQLADEIQDQVVADAPDVNRDANGRFVIGGEDAANWFIAKNRRLDHQLEAAEAHVKTCAAALQLKEAKDARDAIKQRVATEKLRLKYVLGPSFLEFIKKDLTVKGAIPVASRTYTQGRVRLTDEGGLVCTDPAAFEAFLISLADPENAGIAALYEHKTVKVTMNQTEVDKNMKSGAEVPGWERQPIKKHADYEIGAPLKPKASKKKTTADGEAPPTDEQSEEEVA